MPGKGKKMSNLSSSTCCYPDGIADIIDTIMLTIDGDMSDNHEGIVIIKNVPYISITHLAKIAQDLISFEETSSD
jgi:hypothetical protein